MIPHPDPERRENPIQYLRDREFDIPEDVGEYEGVVDCEECGWAAHEFWVGHTKHLMRQIIYCPACRLTSRFDEDYDWSFFNLTDDE